MKQRIPSLDAFINEERLIGMDPERYLKNPANSDKTAVWLEYQTPNEYVVCFGDAAWVKTGHSPDSIGDIQSEKSAEKEALKFVDEENKKNPGSHVYLGKTN